MLPLDVFTTIYPDGVMSIPRALLISLVGFLLVFSILGILAVFVKLMGKLFDKLNEAASKKEPKKVNISAVGRPLPEDRSEGNLTLINVEDEEAVIIMAIVSNQTGVPLNRLQFNSIRLLEDKQ